MARDRLDTYWFHEQDWDSYAALRDEFTWEVPDEFNTASYICDRWATDESRVALFYEHADGTTATHTFAQLRRAADGLARFLAARGVDRGDRVAVNVPQKPATVISHLAAWKLGAVSVPLSQLFGPDAVEYRLDDCDAEVCIVDEANVDAVRECRGDVDALETVLTVDCDDIRADERDFRDAVETPGDPVETAAMDPEEPAMVLYTSGTTGPPKGVVHPHRTLLGFLPVFVATISNLTIDGRSVYWTPAEWAWAGTLYDVVFPAMFFGRPQLAFAGAPFDPERTFDLVDRYAVSNLFAPPTALRAMTGVETPPERWDLDHMRVVAGGGEALGASLVEWGEETLDVAMHEFYGQSEQSIVAGGCTALIENKPGTVGPQLPGHDVHIVDSESLADRPTGESGEIAVEENPGSFIEYWNEPEKTAAKKRDGLVLMEDIGELDDDGFLTFHARKDDVIISAGYRIGPEEIEETLATHGTVADAGVIGVPDEERGEVPKAFVTPADDASVDESELKEHVRERLAAYEYPRAIEVVDELPVTVTGKLRRESLREREGLSD